VSGPAPSPAVRSSSLDQRPPAGHRAPAPAALRSVVPSLPATAPGQSISGKNSLVTAPSPGQAAGVGSHSAQAHSLRGLTKQPPRGGQDAHQPGLQQARARPSIRTPARCHLPDSRLSLVSDIRSGRPGLPRSSSAQAHRSGRSARKGRPDLPLLEACAAICKSCGDECERHPNMQHCRVCAG